MNDRQQGQSFRNLPRPQKAAVVSLGVVAVAILVVWFWQFNTRINNPFTISKEEIAQAEKLAADKAIAQAADKIKDTDTDGLTDYDEINIHKTSPYLEDTDGDNLSDFEEIKLGKDPLCAEGSSCGLINGSQTIATASSTEGTTATPAENVDQELLIKALSGEGDASVVKQILIQGGASAEQVNLLSDEDLMAIYQEVLQAQNLSDATNTETSINQ